MFQILLYCNLMRDLRNIVTCHAVRKYKTLNVHFMRIYCISCPALKEYSESSRFLAEMYPHWQQVAMTPVLCTCIGEKEKPHSLPLRLQRPFVSNYVIPKPYLLLHFWKMLPLEGLTWITAKWTGGAGKVQDCVLSNYSFSFRAFSGTFKGSYWGFSYKESLDF